MDFSEYSLLASYLTTNHLQLLLDVVFSEGSRSCISYLVSGLTYESTVVAGSTGCGSIEWKFDWFWSTLRIRIDWRLACDSACWSRLLCGSRILVALLFIQSAVSFFNTFLKVLLVGGHHAEMGFSRRYLLGSVMSGPVLPRNVYWVLVYDRSVRKVGPTIQLDSCGYGMLKQLWHCSSL